VDGRKKSTGIQSVVRKNITGGLPWQTDLFFLKKCGLPGTPPVGKKFDPQGPVEWTPPGPAGRMDRISRDD
jgi:hypothetical protein